jgi:phosphopantothenoylcysteine decarboxylase/phosphopantothenate--cysteine ligase
VAEAKSILLVVAGGIAAYKCLDLTRRLKERGHVVRAILTSGGAQFVTPLSLSAITGEKVYQDMFSLTDENEMGHIRLARDPDLIVVAPATADLMARMAAGMANDLASAVLLASQKPILLVPAMNTAMWTHPATQANIATLKARGCLSVGPGAGDLACGETGSGRLAEVAEILDAIDRLLNPARPLDGLRAIVTSGPTREPIDPVRYISNHSSGKQGHAIAKALARLGAKVTLVSGPVAIPDPEGVKTVKADTAEAMLKACRRALPADIAVCAAAVADWRVQKPSAQKMKKQKDAAPPALALAPNPDILATLAAGGKARPALVVGFAAETENVVSHAQIKLKNKGCDWILANDVALGTATFGGDMNRIHLVTAKGVEDWPVLTKDEVAARLAERIAGKFAAKGGKRVK